MLKDLPLGFGMALAQQPQASSGLHLSGQTASYNFSLLCPVASEQFPIM